MTKAFSRLISIDSRRWIQFLLHILPRLDDVDFTALSPMKKQMLNMFYTTIWQETIVDFAADEVWDNLYVLSDCPVMLGELIDLLRYKLNEIGFIDIQQDFHTIIRWICIAATARSLLVALDFLSQTLREGVVFKGKKTDVLLITLNKSEDVRPLHLSSAIAPGLFHWQVIHDKCRFTNRPAAD